MIPAHFEADIRAGAESRISIFQYEGEIRSGIAAAELEGLFRRLSAETVQGRLAARRLPPSLIHPFEIRRENAASPEKVTGNRIGGLVPYLILIFCFVGAIYPAIDLSAGEKERGTMETLLCSPVGRTDIVLGKFLMVLTSSLAAVALACLSLAFSLRFGGIGKGAAELGLTHVDPAGVAGTLVLILPVAVFFSAAMFTLGLCARNHREALSYLQPLMFVIVLPAVIGMMPGIELNTRLALVPILNISLASREMLTGAWHWPELALIFASTTAYASAALAVAVRMFGRESVVFRV